MIKEVKHSLKPQAGMGMPGEGPCVATYCILNAQIESSASWVLSDERVIILGRTVEGVGALAGTDLVRRPPRPQLGKVFLRPPEMDQFLYRKGFDDCLMGHIILTVDERVKLRLSAPECLGILTQDPLPVIVKQLIEDYGTYSVPEWGTACSRGAFRLMCSAGRYMPVDEVCTEMRQA